jgi:hypothetical protein
MHRCWLAVATMLCALTASARCEAASIDAASGAAADIQAAIDKAQPGDTVTIPPGRYLFEGQVHAPDGIHLKGAGRDRTLLIKNDDLSEWHAMFTIDSRTGRPFIFSGITLQGRLDVLQGANRKKAATNVKDQGLVIQGAARDVQIYDSRFTKFLRAGIEFEGTAGSVHGNPTGVVYHNEFIDNWYPYLGYGIAIDGDPTSWNRPAVLGSGDALFVEDNSFDRNRHCVTGSNGAVYVARYNHVKDNYQDAGAFDAHGLTPSWPRGARSVEIYKNTVDDSIRRWAGAAIRGGSGVVWGNTWQGVTHGVALMIETPPPKRALASYPALDQIGNPDAVYVWDNSSSGDNVYQVPMPGHSEHGVSYWLQENRDYFLEPKPGYRPFTYPHPLRRR